MFDMTDEELQAILSGGGEIAKHGKDAASAAKMAEFLRDMTPQLGMRGNSRVQRASHPLEVVANVMGAYKQKKALDRQIASDAKKTEAMTAQNQAVLAALLRRGKPAGAQPNAGPSPMAFTQPDEEQFYPPSI